MTTQTYLKTSSNFLKPPVYTYRTKYNQQDLSRTLNMATNKHDKHLRYSSQQQRIPIPQQVPIAQKTLHQLLCQHKLTNHPQRLTPW